MFYPRLDFFAEGSPRSQGSMRRGGTKVTKAGKLQRTLAHSDSTLEGWRDTVATAATQAMAAARLTPADFDEALDLNVAFILERPRSVTRPRPETGLDVDKLLRAVMDAMEKVVYPVDSRVCSVQLSKEYGDRPGVRIIVF